MPLGAATQQTASNREGSTAGLRKKGTGKLDAAIAAHAAPMEGMQPSNAHNAVMKDAMYKQAQQADNGQANKMRQSTKEANPSC